MSLPQMTAPKFTTTLPSTGEKVVYRPFLVREQKKLLVAVDGDAEQQTQSVEDIIRACTFDAIDPTNITAYDAEFLFVQIRARSIGENVDLILSCSACDANQQSSLDLTSVQVSKPAGHAHEIDLGDQIMLVLQDPDLRAMDELRGDNTPDAVVRLIARSIKTIWKADEMFAAQDYTLAELIEFVENLSPKNLAQLESYFDTLPVLRHDIEFECKECGAKNTAVLEGLQSFFV